MRAEKLAHASKELFEIGALEGGSLCSGYLRRLNTFMGQCRRDMENNVPATLADAIRSNGTLGKHAELVVFGSWLINGRPGAKPRPGKSADPKKILKCVAAVMVEIKLAPVRKLHARPDRGRESKTREITKHALADQWEKLFGEKIKPSNFDAPLRSARLILSDYLQYLKSGAAIHGGKKIRKSLEIERALNAINGFLPAPKISRPDIFAEPDAPRPATLVPFEIPLGYQSDNHAEEHRRLPSSTKLHPQLRYVPQMTSTTSPSGKARADRKGTITMVPDVEIRRDYTVEALIDRVVILVQVSKHADPKVLNEILKTKTGAKSYVKDILHNQELGKDWGAPLSGYDPLKLTGFPLAILIQEPTPVLLSNIVKTIDGEHGIVGPKQLHLIEVSIDFYPRKPCPMEEAVLRRERMVGLLQRHHWTRPSRILEPDSATPRYADARQLHDNEDKLPERVLKTRYLFAHVSSPGKMTTRESDSMLTDERIRNRVLTTNQGYPLWLNSTVSKGEKSASHLISIQNKITDRRNPGKSTHVSLPDEERRARMEVTISGSETLKSYGLNTTDDLSHISVDFR